MKLYAQTFGDASLRQQVREKFASLVAQISAANDETDLSALLSQIPQAPKVESGS